jgi:hypothetical protein
MKTTVAFFSALFFSGMLNAQCYHVASANYNFIPLTSPTVVNIPDDHYSQKIAIGFPFCFYGSSNDSLIVGENAVLSFNISQAGGYCTWPIGAAIPTPSILPLNSILFPFEDLQLGAGGSIIYQTTGVMPNRKFIVEFDSVAMYSCNNLFFSGQVILSETTNEIEMDITQKALCPSWNGGNAIEGIQNATGTEAVVIPGRNYPTQWTATNDAWTFTPTCDVCSGVGIHEMPQTELNLFVSGENEITIIPNGMDYKVISAINMLGQEVKFTQNGNTISLKEFTPGLYIINLEVNGNCVAKKVLLN